MAFFIKQKKYLFKAKKRKFNVFILKLKTFIFSNNLLFNNVYYTCLQENTLRIQVCLTKICFFLLVYFFSEKKY